jgi:hypothetical protein
MQLITVSDPSKTKDLACAYLQLAWKACGTETGMGYLQAVPSLSLSDVLKHCPPTNTRTADGWFQLRADYLAGRMVKAYVNFNEDGLIEIENNTPQPDYQGWALTFVSHLALLTAAANVVGATITPAQ